jgi:hypothetical protein
LQLLAQKIEQLEHYKQLENEFSEKSKTCFEKNIQVLKSYFPQLHTQLHDYQPGPHFSFKITKTGLANFQPTNVKVPLYGDDPIAQVEAQIEKYTKNPVFGRGRLMGKPDPAMRDDGRLHTQYMYKLAEAMGNFSKKSCETLKTLPADYPTCLIFGVGLGYHIPLLLQRHEFEYIFICEPDIETFYASLFCLDWAALIEQVNARSQCLFIQVGINYDQFFSFLQHIAGDIGAFALVSSFCYQHTPTPEVNRLIKEFFDRFTQLHYGYGFYNDAVTGLAHCFSNLEYGPVIFTPKAKLKLETKKIPAFVVANGPSLDQSIDFLRERQNDAVIFASGTAFQSLLKAGIKADFHVLVERTRSTYDFLVETTDPAVLKHTNLLTVDVMYPEVLKLYQWVGMSLKGPEAATLFCQNEGLRQHRRIPSLPNGGPLVANTSLSFANMMGFEEIYLFGVDNGYPVDGDSHSKLSVYIDPKYENRFKLNLKGEFELPGNLGGKVRATSLLLTAKNQMDTLVARFKDHAIYNVGQGALIKGAEPLHEDDVLVPRYKGNKTELIEQIKSFGFDPFEVDGNLSDKVGFEDFHELCDYLLEISQTPFSTRKEAFDILIRQSRVVYAYRKHRYPHLFHVIKGSLLYYHCPMINALYYFDDEQVALELFSESLILWDQYVRSMQEDFPKSWRTLCNYTLDSVLKNIKKK